MRWTVFLVALLVTVALDTSLMGALSIGATAPQIAPVLAVFVALGAPRITALWACLLIGLMLDLCDPAVDAGLRPFHLVGPHALGYLFAANLILPLRGMVVRRNPLTIGVLAVIFGIAAGLVVVILWSIRGLYPDTPTVYAGSALGEFGRSALRALYSGALGVPIGWFLVRSAPLWGFPSFVKSGRR